MRIEKLKSGNYRVQKTIDGIRRSFTFDHKPTQKDISQALFDAKEKEKQRKGDNALFVNAANRYIALKENVLSPTTLRFYDQCLRTLPNDFLNIPLCDIHSDDIQKVVYIMSVGRSAKTVKNYYGFIMSIINMYIPSPNIRVTLPLGKKPDDYIPTAEQVKSVMELAKGSKFYTVFMLGAHGLRRSEILALTLDDVHENYVDINKSKVLDINNKWIIKDIGKTEASLRKVPISPDLSKLIHEQGCIYEGHPSQIIKHLHIYQDKAGVPRFRFHLLRHFYCTELSSAGFTVEDIMALGGWESDSIMKKVYRHQRIKENEAEQKRAAEKILSLLT
jgi:integrase